MERSDDDDAKDLSSGNLDDEYREYVETDPTGRYGRYDDILGKGAYKTVYRAFDDLDGIEVAWNQVDIRSTLHNSGHMERLYSELHLLKMLKHENIMKFCNSWVDHQRKNVNFITEIFTSGTLRQYRQKHKSVNLRAIKHWCCQILQGLVYLHGHDPPIIHRDLKCDNIFINGNSGEVKIGDLGLALILSQASAAHSVIGTPEFMAPELYEEHYNELVDIYSFGMCLLELVTFEYPYSECTNAAQIYKRVTSGRRPEALNKVKDLEMRKFIEKCLASASERLHARELLMDQFLQMDEDKRVIDSYHSTILDPHDDLRDLYPSFKGKESAVSHDKLSGEGSISKSGLTLSENCGLDFQRQVLRRKRSRDFRIKVKKLDDSKVHIRFRITSSRGGVRFIQFDFDLEIDTALTVAQEMISELDLVDQDPTIVAVMIDAELMALLPDWKPGSCLEEVVVSKHDSKQQELAPESSEVEVPVVDELPISTFSSEVADNARSPNEICVYGRFEEVEFHLSDSQHTHQEPDSAGGFSDFSSEQLEGGCSDLSLDASIDGLNVQTTMNDMLAEQEMEEVIADVKLGMPPQPGESSLSVCGEHKLDSDIDSEELRLLMLLQKQEVEYLQSKHDQELLALKMQLSQEAQISISDLILQKQSSLGTLDRVVQSNTREVVEQHLHFNDEVIEVPQKAFKERLDTAVCETEVVDPHRPYSLRDASVGSELDEKRGLDADLEQENTLPVTDSKSQTIMPGQDILVSDGCDNAGDSLNGGTAYSQKEMKAGKPSNFTSTETQSEPSGEGVYVNKGGRVPHLLKSSVEPLSSRNLGLHPSSQEQAFAYKRQSHLEYYKCMSNQREKLLPDKQHGPSDGISRQSDSKEDEMEQARKLHLQKTIADLEAKTLECLSQSSSYVAKSVGKNSSSQPASLGKQQQV